MQLCLNGWRKFCTFGYHFIVIGEFESSLQDEFPWVEFIYCPTKEKVVNQYNPHLDIQHKMEIVTEKYSDEYDGFIRIADDNYAIRPFSLEDITTVHHHSLELVGTEDAPTSFWSHDKWKTRQLLDREQLPHINYTIHYPYWYKFSKLKEIWDKFNMRNESYVLEDIYFNYYEHSEPILDSEIRFGVWNSDTYNYVLENAISKPNIKFICNSAKGWSKEFENDLEIMINKQ